MRDLRTRTIGAASLAAIAAALGVAACSSFDYLTAETGLPPSAQDCGGCHVEIYEEFRSSPHAQAWTRPAFVVASSDRTFADCLPCHAPDSVFGDGIPGLRTAHRDEGVTCLTCHFDAGSMAGPVDSDALVDPHPIAVRRDIYRRSDLCGVCHEGTFREWSTFRGADARTCQDCHMEPVRRKLTQATSAVSEVLVAFEREADGRRHTFHIPTIDVFDGALESAVLPDAHRDTETLRCTLELTNTLPHLIPTGDFGFRRLIVTTVARASDGTELATLERSLFKELGQALRPGTPQRLELTLPPRTARVHVRVSVTKESDAPRHTIHEREHATP